MIYISTGGFSRQTALETVKKFLELDIRAIELSGGLYEESQIRDLKNLSKELKFQVHNYFPPPSTPFVFNLASLDKEISQRSYNHALNSMEVSASLGGTCYSFHAGFLLDLKVAELGKKVKKRKLNDRKESFSMFIDNVIKLSEKAEKLGLTILLENNVLSKSNFNEFEGNSLLMVDSEECVDIMKLTPNNVQLLIDVAHLKVSSLSLGFDPVIFLERCNPWIYAYHLSDNEGTSDTNDIITNTSWFWPYLKTNLEYYTIEVYSEDLFLLKSQIDLLAKKLKA